MTIRLHNTATRQKEDFVPIDAEDVRMYVCGPTVYDRAHMGNARAAVVFDVLYRLLRHEYGAEHVTYVRNITDVDDKINARAAETGRPIGDITAETTQWYLDDMDALGVMRPSIKGEETDRAMPRATGWIAPMITMIEDLIAKGHAYAAEGHALFAVDSYKEYGKLSGRSVDDMIAGARVEVAPYKRNPMDFVLWKPSTDDQPGWDSPWGRGRPGWHIECSAMAAELLGESFDIHGGGNDLQFPHHENEIAQSRCAGHGFARYWLHNEMLQVEGKKMSKSLGNFFTVRDLLEQGVPGEVIRFVMLSTHYRKPMDWTSSAVEEATKTLTKWHRLIGTGIRDLSSEAPADVVRALEDDLNTPRAIAELHKLANQGKTAELNRGAYLLGLLTLNLEDWYKEPELPNDIVELVNAVIEARKAAKDKRDYPQADAIREALSFVGIELKDIVGGSEFTYDLLASSRPLVKRLNELLESGDDFALNTLSQSLQRDGFRVSFYTVRDEPKDRVQLVVGRSEGERSRLIEELRAQLKELIGTLV